MDKAEAKVDTKPCNECGMPEAECDAKIVRQQYAPAKEQTCCVSCTYLWTHA